MALSVNTKERRAERVQVASRVLAVLVARDWKSVTPELTHQKLAEHSVDYADALLARIDETAERLEMERVVHRAGRRRS